jgi:hypothetical protein
MAAPASSQSARRVLAVCQGLSAVRGKRPP